MSCATALVATATACGGFAVVVPVSVPPLLTRLTLGPIPLLVPMALSLHTGLLGSALQLLRVKVTPFVCFVVVVPPRSLFPVTAMGTSPLPFANVLLLLIAILLNPAIRVSHALGTPHLKQLVVKFCNKTLYFPAKLRERYFKYGCKLCHDH